MKILIISPTPTHPTTAGNRARVLSLALALQQLGHEVSFALGSVAQPDLQAMRGVFGDRLHILACSAPHQIRGILPRLRRKLLRLIGDERAYLWGLDDYYDPDLAPQIAAIFRRESFDAVLVEYVFMSKAFEVVPRGPIRILDTHDHFALRHRTFLRAGKTPQWFSTTAREETRGFLRADCVVAIQEEEAARFTEQMGALARPVVTVGHLLDLRQRVTPAAAPHAVFLASANPINVDAARYLIASVLPRVLEAVPDFRFILAGDVGSAFVGVPAVECIGRVAAVSDAFGRAAIAVNPVRMGTGLNIKMLDALACGMPCVATEAGSRGLGAQRGVAFEVVANDDAEAMASAILALLADRQRARRLSDAGFQFAKDWNHQQLAGLAGILQGAAGRDSERAAQNAAVPAF